MKTLSFFSKVAFSAAIMGIFMASSAFAASVTTSENWSGYTASNGPYTSVGATWTIPQVTSTNSVVSADVTWVGIGGLTTHDLIQAGTQTVFQNGVPSYQAWYEMLPANSISIPLTVNPGDVMTVSLAQESAATNQWQISFDDQTTGQTYQTLVTYASSLSSAEWIEEMPSSQTGIIPLDNFGTVSFSNAFAAQNGSQLTLSELNAQPITMITSQGQIAASPSSLGSSGNSFSVTRESGDTTLPASQSQHVGRWQRTGVGVQGFTPQSRTSWWQQQSSTQTQQQLQGYFGRRFQITFRFLRERGW